MVVSVQKETEEMTRAFNEFLSDMGASVKNMTPQTVRTKMERYSESMASMGSVSSAGGGGNGASPRAGGSSSLLRDLQCGALGVSNMDLCSSSVSARGDCSEYSSGMDWTTSASGVTYSRSNGSDWTVQVYDGTESVVYHVHTLALSYGPRSSQYFDRLFEKKRMAGMAAAAAGGGGGRRGTPSSNKRDRGAMGMAGVGEDDAVTEVYLPAPSAAAFPLLLDYVYHDKLRLDTSNAPAMRHLSKHFSVQALFEKVGAFVKRDLTVKTAPSYCVGADAVMDKELLDAAMRKCAENLAARGADQVEVEQLPPKLMGELVTSRHVSSSAGRCGPERLSEVVCRYIRGRNERLGDEAFYWLTQPRVLPSVSSSEAVFLLSFGQKYPAVLHEGGEVSLKRRCMDALGRDWDAGLGEAVEASVMEREGTRDPSPPLSSPLDSGVGDQVAGVDRESNKAKADAAMRYRNLPLEMRVELLEMALMSARKERGAAVSSSTSGMRSSPRGRSQKGKQQVLSGDLRGSGNLY